MTTYHFDPDGSGRTPCMHMWINGGARWHRTTQNPMEVNCKKCKALMVKAVEMVIPELMQPSENKRVKE